MYARFGAEVVEMHERFGQNGRRCCHVARRKMRSSNGSSTCIVLVKDAFCGIDLATQSAWPTMRRSQFQVSSVLFILEGQNKLIVAGGWSRKVLGDHMRTHALPCARAARAYIRPTFLSMYAFGCVGQKQIWPTQILLMGAAPLRGRSAAYLMI
eukprot:1433222-Pleurochrysis_carterae.AAC.2